VNNYLLLAANAEINGLEYIYEPAMGFGYCKGKKSKKAGKSRQRLNVFERGGVE
jgi:hypothetical protein